MNHAERFDPSGAEGTLIDSEHRARYRWAAQIVAGKDVLDAGCGLGYGLEIIAAGGAASVTGVDIDSEAVAEAERRFGEHAAAVRQGDLRELPFDDGSFDLTICFEAIEHIQHPEKALAELRRVLRPDGVLIVSSPNPDAYVGGNEFHVHEFRPSELREAVGAHFEHVAGYRQDAWLGSAISAAAESSANGNGLPQLLLGAGEDAAEGPPYSVAVASDAVLPAMEGLLAVGNSFDVRWWQQQLDNMKAQVLEMVQREMQAVEREQSALRRLQDTSDALLEANQELAQIPLLRHRLASLEEKYGDLSERHQQVLESTSWRITAPLRRRSR